MVSNNAFILTEMKEKATQLGIEQGIRQGIKQGLIEGIEQGIQQRDIEIVLNMNSEGLDEITISRLTKIDINKVKEIKEKYQS